MPVRRAALQAGFDFLYAAQNVGAPGLLVGSVNRNVGSRGVVQESEDAVILRLLDGIELVVVALRALDGDSEDTLLPMPSMRSNMASMRNCSGSTPPSSLTIELRRNPVATSWSWVRWAADRRQFARSRNGRTGRSRLKCVDDPVAVGPDDARIVLLIAVGIGVARAVQPDSRAQLSQDKQNKKKNVLLCDEFNCCET